MIFVTEFEPRVSFINARARSNQTTLPLMMMMMMGVGTVATDRVIVRPTNCPSVRMSDRPTFRTGGAEVASKCSAMRRT